MTKARAAADGRESEHGDEPQTYRPALVKLTGDVEDLQRELLVGFADRSALLEWLQRVAVRTLGELPQRVYWEIARQFVLDQLVEVEQGALLASLLRPAERDRHLPEHAVEELRERFVATQLRPAYHRAYRELRTDATEYVDETSDDSAHDPARQRHPALRPGLRELDEWQQRALAELLGGFADRRAILDWSSTLEHATHGELDEVEPPEWATDANVGVGGVSGSQRDFIERCYSEPSARRVLTAPGEDSAEIRELFAAFWILPAMNRGVRVLAGRAGELPDVEVERSAPKSL